MKFSSIILAGFVSGCASQAVLASPYARVGAPFVGARTVGAPLYGGRAVARPVASPYFGRAVVAAPAVAAPAVAAPAKSEEELEAEIEEAKAAWEKAQSSFESGLEDIKSNERTAESDYFSMLQDFALSDSDDIKTYDMIVKLRDLDDSLGDQNSARKKFQALTPSSSIQAVRAASLNLQVADAAANNDMYSVIDVLNIADIPMGDKYPVTQQYTQIEKGGKLQMAADKAFNNAVQLGLGSGDEAAYLAAKQKLHKESLSYDEGVAKLLGMNTAKNVLGLDKTMYEYDLGRASYEKAYDAYEKDPNLFNKHKLEIATMTMDSDELGLASDLLGYFGNANSNKLGSYMDYKQSVIDVEIAKKQNAQILPEFQYKYKALAESLSG